MCGLRSSIRSLKENCESLSESKWRVGCGKRWKGTVTWNGLISNLWPKKDENIPILFRDFSEWIKSEKLERQNLSYSF